MRNDGEGDMNTIIDIISCDRSRHTQHGGCIGQKFLGVCSARSTHFTRVPISDGDNGVGFRMNRGFLGRIL